MTATTITSTTTPVSSTTPTSSTDSRRVVSKEEKKEDYNVESEIREYI